jgi:hypothetical protein
VDVPPASRFRVIPDVILKRAGRNSSSYSKVCHLYSSPTASVSRNASALFASAGKVKAKIRNFLPSLLR